MESIIELIFTVFIIVAFTANTVIQTYRQWKAGELWRSLLEGGQNVLVLGIIITTIAVVFTYIPWYVLQWYVLGGVLYVVWGLWSDRHNWGKHPHVPSIYDDENTA